MQRATRKDWGQEEKGTTEGEMVGWPHWLNGHEFELAPGDSEGQGSLALQSMELQEVRHDWATEQQQICYLSGNKPVSSKSVHFDLYNIFLMGENAMAPHSSTLA